MKRNMFIRDFDWDELKKQVQQIEQLKNGANVPASDAVKKYVRLQRFCREKSHVENWRQCRDIVIDISKELTLSPRQATFLYQKLQKISSRHLLGLSLESMQRAPNAVKALTDVYNSLSRLAAFSNKLLCQPPAPQMRIVKNKLENAAHFWAAKKSPQKHNRNDSDSLEEIQAYGFDIWTDE